MAVSNLWAKLEESGEMTTEYLKQRSTSRQVNQKYRIQVKAGPGLF